MLNSSVNLSRLLCNRIVIHNTITQQGRQQQQQSWLSTHIRPQGQQIKDDISHNLIETNQSAFTSVQTARQTYRQALQHEDFFNVRNLVSVKQLFDNRVHLGHKIGSLNVHMSPYLFGNRLGVCIFDLEQTVKRLQDAMNFAAHIAFRGGIIMFINNNKETAYMTEKTATECGEFSHCRPFQLNTFANSERFFGTVVRLPDLVIFLRTQDSVFSMHTAINHCAKLLIPTIGIVDTNVDPRLITYPVPGNDDTPEAIHLYLQMFKKAIQAGKEKRKQLIGDV